MINTYFNSRYFDSASFFDEQNKIKKLEEILSEKNFNIDY